MKIILDTNILIHIEDQKELVPNLQELLQIFRKYGHLIFIHPASFRDIDNDQNIPRRKIISSKLKGYPIIPKYHERLFPDYKKRQMRLIEYSEINIPGNAIRKAYLSHSNIKKISTGDILLFYRSQDQKAITSLGVVDQEPVHTDDLDLILRSVGKRSVYSYKELEEWTQKPVYVILFRHHLNLPNPLNLDYLRHYDISVPQSIIELNHIQYTAIKKGGKLDERFIVS